MKFLRVCYVEFHQSGKGKLIEANGFLNNIAPAIKYLSFVIPVCLPQYGVGLGAGHAVKLLRYPAIPLDTGTSPV